MPKTKRSKAQTEALALAQETCLHGPSSALEKALESKDRLLHQQLEEINAIPQQVTITSDNSNPAVSSLLAASEIRLQTEAEKIVLLQSALEAERKQSAKQANELKVGREHIAKLSEKLGTMNEQSKKLYQELRVERRRRQRGEFRKNVLGEQIALLKSVDVKKDQDIKKVSADVSTAVTALVFLEKDNFKLQSELSQALERCTSMAGYYKQKLTQSSNRLKASRQKISMLRKRCDRAAVVKRREVIRAEEKLRKKLSVHKLLHKGVYTSRTRNLIRLLVKAGCSREYVGDIIHAVFKTAGMSVMGDISRRTVSRVMIEGFYAAQIQLGHEIAQAKSVTFSADDSTHRAIGFTSRHVNLKVDADQKIRFFGIHAPKDGSSEESIQAWKEVLGSMMSVYNQSPLGQRTGSLLRLVNIFAKLCRMITDHCSKEKKDARILEQLKMESTYQLLGEDEILEISNEELRPHFVEARKQMIKAVGGEGKWKTLSELEQSDHVSKMMEKLVIQLGKESFDTLPESEQRTLKLFIWAGCGCHKDLNSVRGGNASMMDWWEANGVEGPKLLANRDNAAVLKDKTAQADSDTVTPAQERALEITTQGGIKAAKIAGEIFNNKNDKKGHHNVYRSWWLQYVEEEFTFPGTSNNRFQSYCDAAAVMILHLSDFIKVLEFIRDKKQTRRFSHMEQNLWDALHCIPTLTELVVLALYALAVSYPYMQLIRAAARDKTNMLDLGDLHRKIPEFINRLIEDPKFLLSAAADFKVATLNGKSWYSQDVFDAIQKIIPRLPHLEPVLIAFLKGACKTWKRFISEFAPGGLIDEATAEEKDLAWMPPTNDVNEGALGAFRVLMRRQPQLSLLQYNAQAMFFFNETHIFMDENFELADYKFVMGLARNTKTKDLEKTWKTGLIQHAQEKNERKTARKKTREDNARKLAKRIAAVKLIFDKQEIQKLKGEKLKDHLLAYQKSGAPIPSSVTVRTTVGEIRTALQAAIDDYNDGKWQPKELSVPEEPGNSSDSGENFDLDGDGSGSEDED